MKTLRYVLGWLVLSLSLAAHADSSVVCDHSLKATSPLFQNALNNLYSFEYIHHAMEGILQAAGPQEVMFCTSSIAVDKNIYQYLEHVVSVDVYVANSTEPQYSFRLLFQNASIQAFHNVGGQPWIGLNSQQTQQAFASLIASQHFAPLVVPAGTEQVLNIAKLTQSYQRDLAIIDAETFSAMPVAANSQGTTYLVSWLTSNSDNPFASFSMSRGVLVTVFSDKHVEVAENISVKSDVSFSLENQMDQLGSALSSKDTWTSALLEMSQPVLTK